MLASRTALQRASRQSQDDDSNDDDGILEIGRILGLDQGLESGSDESSMPQLESVSNTSESDGDGEDDDDFRWFLDSDGIADVDGDATRDELLDVWPWGSRRGARAGAESNADGNNNGTGNGNGNNRRRRRRSAQNQTGIGGIMNRNPTAQASQAARVASTSAANASSPIDPSSTLILPTTATPSSSPSTTAPPFVTDGRGRVVGTSSSNSDSEDASEDSNGCLTRGRSVSVSVTGRGMVVPVLADGAVSDSDGDVDDHDHAGRGGGGSTLFDWFNSLF
jgi:hypothetical protein